MQAPTHTHTRGAYERESESESCVKTSGERGSDSERKTPQGEHYNECRMQAARVCVSVPVPCLCVARQVLDAKGAHPASAPLTELHCVCVRHNGAFAFAFVPPEGEAPSRAPD